MIHWMNWFKMYSLQSNSLSDGLIGYRRDDGKKKFAS